MRLEEERASGWTSVAGRLCFVAAANCSCGSDEAGGHEAEGCGFGDRGLSGCEGDVVEERADVAVVSGIGVVEELELVGAAGGDGDELVDYDSAGVISAGQGEGLGVVAEVDGGLGGVAALGADEIEAEIVGAGGEIDAGDQIAEVVSAGAAEVDALAGFGTGAEVAVVGAADDVDVGAADGVELAGLRDGETVDGGLEVFAEDSGRVQWSGDDSEDWKADQQRVFQ